MVAWVSAWPNFITQMLPWHFSYRHPLPHNYMRWLNLRIIHLLTWSFSWLVLFLGSLHGEILLTSLHFIIKVQMNLIHYKENIVKSVSNQNVKTKMNLIHFKKNIVELVSKQVVKMNLIYLKEMIVKLVSSSKRSSSIQAGCKRSSNIQAGCKQRWSFCLTYRHKVSLFSSYVSDFHVLLIPSWASNKIWILNSNEFWYFRRPSTKSDSLEVWSLLFMLSSFHLGPPIEFGS